MSSTTCSSSACAARFSGSSGAMDDLLAAGIKVYQYGPRMLHTKALLVDDNLATGRRPYDPSFRADDASRRRVDELHAVEECVRLEDTQVRPRVLFEPRCTAVGRFHDRTVTAANPS